MAYSITYPGLKADLLQTVDDQSDEYLANLDAIIQQAETQCLRDLDLEMFQQEIQAGNLAIGNRLFARPSGLVKANAVWLLTGSSRKYIEKRSKGYCDMFAEDSTVQAFPSFYAEQDETNMMFVDTPDQAYPVIIYGIQRPAGLSDDNPQTWLSKYAGDLLLLACLIGSENYLSNAAQAGTWKAEYTQDRLPKAKLELRGLSRDDYELSRQASTAGTPL